MWDALSSDMQGQNEPHINRNFSAVLSATGLLFGWVSPFGRCDKLGLSSGLSNFGR